MIFTVIYFALFAYVFNSDPEIKQNVSEIVVSYGYPCEIHYIVTKDGYILTVQRIPRSRTSNTGQKIYGTPILLQHGLMDSAHTFIDNLANESLAFILSDYGYDVWLANSRGNKYSQSHVCLDPQQDEFWKFSWDEMAEYDLPQTVDYIINATGYKKIGYIGHSQGTEIAFAKLNSDKQLNEKLFLFVALAPITRLKYVTSPVRLMLPLARSSKIFFLLFGRGEFIPSERIIDLMTEEFCSTKFAAAVCRSILFLLSGSDAKNLNISRIPVYTSHTPSGTSTRNILHYMQAIRSGCFKMFDYGKVENIKHYGQSEPPLYGIANIKVPVAVFYGGNDALSAKEDVEFMMKQLTSLVYHRLIEEYNHLDFVWGINAADDIYPDIIFLIEKYRLH